MARPSSARQVITPPEKGSFPLDHGGECKPLFREFMACLKAHGNEHIPCKAIGKKYLECRQDKGLMAKEDLSKVGYRDDEASKTRVTIEGKREEQGFVGGTHIDQRTFWHPFKSTPRGGHA